MAVSGRSGELRAVIFIIGPTRLHTHRVSAAHTVVDVPTRLHAYLRIIIPVPTIPLWVTQSRPGKSCTGRRATKVCAGVCELIPVYLP